MVHRDEILEGVAGAELPALRSIAEGRPFAVAALARLQAKGWVDVVNGVPLITLTGRTLIEHPPLG